MTSICVYKESHLLLDIVIHYFDPIYTIPWTVASRVCWFHLTRVLQEEILLKMIFENLGSSGYIVVMNFLFVSKDFSQER